MAFSYYKSITCDASQAGSADSTNWPLTIGLGVGPQAADADLKTVGNGGYVQNANGYDIRPYSDSGLTTALTYELVYYDGANGKLEMHVKIPTLSHSSNTVIYLAFGDSGISTDGSSNTTWESNYMAVWHFEDGSSLNLNDSTSSANTLTNSSATAAVGQIDGGIAFNGSNQYVSSTPTASMLQPVTDNKLTMSVWVKNGNTGQSSVYLHEFNHNVYDIIYGFAASTYEIFWINGGIRHTIKAGVADTNFHKIDISFDGVANTLHMFYDGVSTYAATETGDLANDVSVTGWFVGASGTGPTNPFNGRLDEFRISKVARSDDYLLADFNAQKASSTFITWGTKTSVGGSVQADPSNIRRRIFWGFIPFILPFIKLFR